MNVEAYVVLTQGLLARVDPDDLDELSRYRWHARGNPNGTYYAVARINKRDTPMHRFLLGYPPEVDHRNLNTLDNRKDNLRACSRSQNQANKRLQKNNTSGFRGVSFMQGKWKASVSYDGTVHYLGCYATREEAARVYDHRAAQLYGEFARLNFPIDEIP